MLKMRHGTRNASEIDPATEAMQNETERKTTRKLTSVRELQNTCGQPNTHVTGVPKERRWQGRRKEMKKY